MEKNRKIKEITLNCDPKSPSELEKPQDTSTPAMTRPKKRNQTKTVNYAEKMPFTVKIY